MVCDYCDPHKEHRYKEEVEIIGIPIPTVALQDHEEYYFEILKCKYCNQAFNVPKYSRKI